MPALQDPVRTDYSRQKMPEMWPIMTDHLPLSIRGELRQIDEELHRVRTQKEELITRAVESCDHALEHLRLYHDRDPWGYWNPPWLICANCGLTEEGWGCGYSALRHGAYQDVPKISRGVWLVMKTRMIRQRRENC
jgi:hypothetical protein